MQRVFQTSLQLHQPEIVFILGKKDYRAITVYCCMMQDEIYAVITECRVVFSLSKAT